MRSTRSASVSPATSASAKRSRIASNSATEIDPTSDAASSGTSDAEVASLGADLSDASRYDLATPVWDVPADPLSPTDGSAPGVDRGMSSNMLTRYRQRVTQPPPAKTASAARGTASSLTGRQPRIRTSAITATKTTVRYVMEPWNTRIAPSDAPDSSVTARRYRRTPSATNHTPANTATSP